MDCMQQLPIRPRRLQGMHVLNNDNVWGTTHSRVASRTRTGESTRNRGRLSKLRGATRKEKGFNDRSHFEGVTRKLQSFSRSLRGHEGTELWRCRGNGLLRAPVDDVFLATPCLSSPRRGPLTVCGVLRGCLYHTRSWLGVGFYYSALGMRRVASIRAVWRRQSEVTSSPPSGLQFFIRAHN